MSKFDELKRLASDLPGWQNLTECWPKEDEDSDQSEWDWEVGAIDEDGNDYPVMSVCTWQYDSPEDAEKLARYYAAANPAAVLELIVEVDRLRESTVSVDTTVYIAEELSVKIEHVERERDQLRAEVEALRKDAARWRLYRQGFIDPEALDADVDAALAAKKS